MKIIATIHNDYTSKFGIPRQSGLAEVESVVVFEPEFRNPDALRGIEGFSHLWLIWKFDNEKEEWNATVRPPRLGGNVRVGVFASRSPYRPNPIGLSSVKLLGVERTASHGVVLRVSGADLADGTKIYDVKPYVPYSDIHADATCGYSFDGDAHVLDVVLGDDYVLEALPENKRETLLKVLSYDPRPSYQNDENRIYGFEFAGFNVKFQVRGNTLTVLSIDDE